LQADSWNYVVFLPVTNSTIEIATNIRQDSYFDNSSASISRLTVSSEAFVNTFEQEIKLYTLLNALGFVGGIFGLLVAV
jgi:hypothetical protein